MALTTVNPSTTPHRPLSRPNQVAEHYNISHMTLWRWRKCPNFPQPLKRGRVVLYDVDAIEQWLSEGV